MDPTSRIDRAKAYRQLTLRTSTGSSTPLRVSWRGSDSPNRIELIALKAALETRISSLTAAAPMRAATCTPRPW